MIAVEVHGCHSNYAALRFLMSWCLCCADSLMNTVVPHGMLFILPYDRKQHALLGLHIWHGLVNKVAKDRNKISQSPITLQARSLLITLFYKTVWAWCLQWKMCKRQKMNFLLSVFSCLYCSVKMFSWCLWWLEDIFLCVWFIYYKN